MKFQVVFTIILLMLSLTACWGKKADKSSASLRDPAENATGANPKREFTLEELSRYDGKNGNLAYIVVKGKIYDVSNSPRFSEGVHIDCKQVVAGTDASANFPHFFWTMRKVPVVGVLKK